MEVFITDVSAFLPNAPVSNDEIEGVLGALSKSDAKTRRIVLNSNRIVRRHYAVNPETGALTHTNAAMTAEAVRRLRLPEGEGIDCLCCGTSTPDLLFPGHALMVLGELGLGECDAVSMAGICIAGMNSLKHAFLNVTAGLHPQAVATGSELASSFTRSRFLDTPICAADPEAVAEKPIRAFDADFLRWMLSDGAGAARLGPKPNEGSISLKIDWIDHVSFAGELETCMYGGGVKRADGRVTGWREVEGIAEAERKHLMAIRQDIKLLDPAIVSTMGRALEKMVKKYDLTPEGVDWFLPHYSSDFFRPRFYEEMRRIGFEVPYERWFTNLAEKGNTGSAAIYIILEELFHSGRLKPGEKLLCFIPESGRFSHCFMGLTVV